MEFGKLASIEAVQFELASEPIQNQSFFANQALQSTQKYLYLGATGYHMKPWVGSWYPAGTPAKAYLEAYAKQFNTLEHNTTHYRIPDLDLVARWRDETPPDFRFCAKIPQIISHSARLGEGNSLVWQFCEAIAGLDNRLGWCFMQLPPDFSVQKLIFLERFLHSFPKHIPLAIEVRHPSFFVESLEAEDYFQLLQNQGVAAVITDVAGRRDVCHMRVTAPVTLIRFVGNNLHATDYSRINEWALRIKYWFEQGLQSVYFFGHEPDNLQAPALCAYAHKTFRALIPEAIMRGPKACVPPPQQGALF